MHKQICAFSSTFVKIADTLGLLKLVKQTSLKAFLLHDVWKWVRLQVSGCF